MVARFNTSDEIIEMRVRDPSGKTLDVRRSNKQDEEAGGRMLRWLIDKWGWRPKLKKDLIDTDTEFLKY